MKADRSQPVTTDAGAVILGAQQWTGDVPPVDRLDRAGAAGLPCGTIRGGGLRVDVAEDLERHGMARLDRDYSRPVRPGGSRYGRPVRAYATQLALPL